MTGYHISEDFSVSEKRCVDADMSHVSCSSREHVLTSRGIFYSRHKNLHVLPLGGRMCYETARVLRALCLRHSTDGRVSAARHVNDRDRQYSLQTRRDIPANHKIGGAFCVLLYFDLRLIGGLKRNAG
jgi:hypothetical protein